MIYHLIYIFTLYAILASIISFIPPLRKWRLLTIRVSMGILFGVGIGLLGFFAGLNAPCSGAFCNLGMALVFSISGFVLGMILTISLLKTVTIKEGDGQYQFLLILSICINIGIIALAYFIMLQQHISLFPALFYWYIPPSY